MNLASALTGGFAKDISVKQDTINLGNQLMFMGIVVLEIPCNMALQRVSTSLICQFKVKETRQTNIREDRPPEMDLGPGVSLRSCRHDASIREESGRIPGRTVDVGLCRGRLHSRSSIHLVYVVYKARAREKGVSPLLRHVWRQCH